jgi:hypothetical protein
VVGQLLRYDTALAPLQDADTDAEYLFNTFSNSLRSSATMWPCCAA